MRLSEGRASQEARPSRRHSGCNAVNRKDWLKVHLMCGVKTNVVTSCVVTDKHAGDSPQFNGLVNATAENFVLNEVSGDKAYSSRKNLKLVCSKAATPYIDFKDNAQPNLKDSVWTRLYHFYAYNQEWFKRALPEKSGLPDKSGVCPKCLCAEVRVNA